jgi:1-acyl-sn-glycerol-3-phosphate acyltransferase
MRYFFVEFGWILFAIFGRYQKTLGKKYVKQMQDRSFILASTHGSYIDALIHTRDFINIRYVIGKFLKPIPLMRDYVSVNHNASDHSVIAEVVNRLKTGQQICIFPAGTRTAPERRMPFTPGIASIAYHSRMPIMPCTMNTEWVGNMLRYTHGHAWSTSVCMFKFGQINTIYTKYHKPIYHIPFLTRIHYNKHAKHNPMSVDLMHKLFDLIVTQAGVKENDIVPSALDDMHLLRNVYNAIHTDIVAMYRTSPASNRSLQYDMHKYEQHLQKYMNMIKDEHDVDHVDTHHQDSAQNNNATVTAAEETKSMQSNMVNTATNASHASLHHSTYQFHHLANVADHVLQSHHDINTLYLVKFGIFIEMLKEAIVAARAPLKIKYARMFAHELQILMEDDPVFRNEYES